LKHNFLIFHLNICLSLINTRTQPLPTIKENYFFAAQSKHKKSEQPFSSLIIAKRLHHYQRRPQQKERVSGQT